MVSTKNATICQVLIDIDQPKVSKQSRCAYTAIAKTMVLDTKKKYYIYTIRMLESTSLQFRRTSFLLSTQVSMLSIRSLTGPSIHQQGESTHVWSIYCWEQMIIFESLDGNDYTIFAYFRTKKNNQWSGIFLHHPSPAFPRDRHRDR